MNSFSFRRNGTHAPFLTQTGSWGRNRLESGPLAPTSAQLFRLPRGGECLYDLRVVFADRRALERKGANLCRITDLPVP